LRLLLAMWVVRRRRGRGRSRGLRGCLVLSKWGGEGRPPSGETNLGSRVWRLLGRPPSGETNLGFRVWNVLGALEDLSHNKTLNPKLSTLNPKPLLQGRHHPHIPLHPARALPRQQQPQPQRKAPSLLLRGVPSKGCKRPFHGRISKRPFRGGFSFAGYGLVYRGWR
jgi:hypothetical protein